MAEFAPQGDRTRLGDAAALTLWGRIIGGQAARRIATLFFALLIVFSCFCERFTAAAGETVGHRLLGPRPSGS